MELNYDSLHSQLRPLPALSPMAELPASELEQHYFDFYGINFSRYYPNSSHLFGSFDAAGFKIASHCFLPESPKGTLFILHGYYDHAGIYGRAIDYGLQKQLAVVIFDLPGHGLSSGERADIESFDHYMEVLKACVQLSEGLPAPWFCLAQSTGAAVLLNYLFSEQRQDQHSSPFEKIAMLAPLVRPHSWNSSGRWAYHASRFLIGKLKRTFTENSNDGEFLAFLKERDFLQPQVLPVQWVGAMNEWIKKFDGFPPSDLNPLIIQGQSDTTVDWHFNVPSIQDKFLTSDILYLPTARHHLVNEVEHLRTEIWQWLDEKMFREFLQKG